jgi:hypothetical protein
MDDLWVAAVSVFAPGVGLLVAYYAIAKVLGAIARGGRL